MSSLICQMALAMSPITVQFTATHPPTETRSGVTPKLAMFGPLGVAVAAALAPASLAAPMTRMST